MLIDALRHALKRVLGDVPHLVHVVLLLHGVRFFFASRPAWRSHFSMFVTPPN